MGDQHANANPNQDQTAQQFHALANLLSPSRVLFLARHPV